MFDFLPSPDPFTQSDYSRVVADLVGPRRSSAAARKLYPTSAYNSLVWDAVTMFTDDVYTCPTRRLAVAAADRGPTFRFSSRM